MVFQMPASDTLHVINALPSFLSNLLSAHAIGFNCLLILFPLLLAIALFFKPTRTTVLITIIFLFFVWWLGQDFGGLSTAWVGTATDFNAAPLVALLILPSLASAEVLSKAAHSPR